MPPPSLSPSLSPSLAVSPRLCCCHLGSDFGLLLQLELEVVPESSKIFELNSNFQTRASRLSFRIRRLELEKPQLTLDRARSLHWQMQNFQPGRTRPHSAHVPEKEALYTGQGTVRYRRRETQYQNCSTVCTRIWALYWGTLYWAFLEGCCTTSCPVLMSGMLLPGEGS